MAKSDEKPIFDRRKKLKNEPGLHALIVGVSGYPNLPEKNQPATPFSFGMNQLSSTSLTAYKIYQWLLTNQASLPIRLASIRLLVSPTDDEVAIEPDLVKAPRATLDNFLKAVANWRNDANTNTQNIAFFYFAGHGIGRFKGDSVMLLQDFGDGIGSTLRHAVALQAIYDGMAPSTTYDKIAQTQLYFVDACRNLPDVITNYNNEQPSQALSNELAGVDKRSAPIYFAAAPGTMAQAVQKDQTVFSKALLDCLNGAAAVNENINGSDDRWHISVHGLMKALKLKLDDWNEILGSSQYSTTDGQMEDAVIRYLDAPPTVDVTIEVEPSDIALLERTRLIVLDELSQPFADIPGPGAQHPYRVTWKAGTYGIGATIAPGEPQYLNTPTLFKQITPPRHIRKVKVSK